MSSRSKSASAIGAPRISTRGISLLADNYTDKYIEEQYNVAQTEFGGPGIVDVGRGFDRAEADVMIDYYQQSKIIESHPRKTPSALHLTEPQLGTETLTPSLATSKWLSGVSCRGLLQSSLSVF